MECGACRFCCWSFNVDDVPDPVLHLTLKPGREHCPYECVEGCSIHGLERYPMACDHFECPYLQGKFIHRPDAFQVVLEELNIGVGSFIPAVPKHVPISVAIKLIRERRTIPAYILIGNEWTRVILTLDRDTPQSWIVKEEDVKLWGNIFIDYGAPIDSTVEPGTVMAG